MALFDFLKKKPSFAKAKAGKKEIEKALGRSPFGRSPTGEPTGEAKDTMIARLAEAPAKRVDRQVKKTKEKSVKALAVLSYDVIKEPHISEKATMLLDSNRYIFKVYPNTNKIEIKKAVEGVYGVDVLSVNIMKNPKKKRRLGKIQGFKSGYTKAIVKIKEGQKIEIL